MAASVSDSHVAMCISSHEGHFCDEGEGGLEVSSNSPSQPRSFIYRLEITECSFLPTRNVAVSFTTKHVLWDCLHTFLFILSARWNIHGWASLSSLIRKAQRKMEEWEEEAGERDFFNCTYAEMPIAAGHEDGERRRKARGWSYSLPGTPSGSWGAWGEQRKVGHFVPSTQVVQSWFIADALAFRFIFITSRIAPFPRSFHFEFY